jgi:hypothetical protein
LSQAGRVAAVRVAASQALFIAMELDGNLPVRRPRPGMDPVRGVDVGVLAVPAVGARGQVGDPQRVPPAIPASNKES